MNTRFVDLASERLGGRVLFANDEFFAPKENLLKPAKPVFIEDKYTDRGKWMDGWETRRRRTPGFDWCVIQMGVPGVLRGVVVDTSYFRGNYPEYCAIDASELEPGETLDPKAADSWRWTEVLPRSALQGDAQNHFEIGSPLRFTHLRFRIYPDGGVARLRVHGEPLPDWSRLLAAGPCVDLAAIENGAQVVDCSDRFFSAPQNLMMPGKSSYMGDGWETKRRRGPGHDWVVVRLAIAGLIRHIEVDTSHFKGNFPESCSVEVCDANADSAQGSWREILPRTLLSSDCVQRFEIADDSPASLLRFNIYPDGGVARLRVLGLPTRDGRMLARLRRFNAASDESARELLLNCCGSNSWVQRMSKQRPFKSVAELWAAAEGAAQELSPGDWMEAFRGHPRIGERESAAQQSQQAQRWSQQEQSAAQAAGESLRELAEANAAYESRFGYIFIVCAAGKSSTEILQLLRRRLQNEPDAEFRVAVEEQRKITRLRLEKMLEL